MNKITFFAVLVLVTGLLAGSLYSAGGNGTDVTHFLSRSDMVSGSKFVGTKNTSFTAGTFDDLKGVGQGHAEVSSNDFGTGTFDFISCSGPAYANIVSVNKNNGDSSLNVTLDPLAPGCFATPSVTAPVTIAITGLFNGLHQTSNNGGTSTTTIFNGTSLVSFKGTLSGDFFSETFMGVIGSIASGPFDGNASTSRNNNLTQVK
jgi:hypothetical protein